MFVKIERETHTHTQRERERERKIEGRETGRQIDQKKDRNTYRQVLKTIT